MKRWRGAWPDRRWAGVVLPLAIARSSGTVVIVIAVSIAVLLLVLLMATIALGAAFQSSAEKRRACLQTLQTLLRLVPWAPKQ